VKNKIHWYDGFFYDKFIAPNQDLSFDIIEDFVSKEMTLLDIGCGTGRLLFKLKDKCLKFDGIDLSEKNINYAVNMLEKNPADNISFFHGDAADFLVNSDIKYDAAILTYVIHEVDEIDRVKLLNIISEKAEKIIIVDYLVPIQKGIMNFINGVVEFLAGKEHYRNFKSYVKNNGLDGLAEKTGLIKKMEIKNSPLTSHFVVFKKRSFTTNKKCKTCVR